MENKIVNTVVIWVSFLSVLLLYVLQKGKGLEGMESPFFNQGGARLDQYLTNIWLNISAFVFITIMFGVMYVTKVNKNLSSLSCCKSDWIIVSCILILFVTKGFWSTPSTYLEPLLTKNEVWHILILEFLAILSIPSMLFAVAWAKEKVTEVSGLLDSKLFFLICVAIATFGLGLLTFYCFSRDIWSDECATLLMIKHSLEDTIASSAVDVHPPLYYLIANLFVKLIQVFSPDCSIIYSAKLASMLPVLVQVILCITIIRKNWGWYVGGMSAVATIGMPLMLSSGQEIRMYGWSMLWVTCIWLSTYMVYTRNRRRDWFCLGIFGLLQAYTQYGICIAVAPLYIYLFIWSIKRRCFHRWCIMILCMGIAYIPWIWALEHYYDHISPKSPGWMPDVNWRIFCELILSPTKDVILLFVIGITGVFVFQKWQQNKKGESLYTLVSILLPFLFVAIMVIVSYVYRPVIAPRVRYVVPMLGCMWYATLMAAHNLRLHNLRLLLTFAMLFVTASELVSFSRIQRHGRSGTKTLYHYFESKPNAVFISNKNCYSRLSTSLITEKPLYSIDPVKQAYLKRYVGRDIQCIPTKNLKKLVAEGKTLYIMSLYNSLPDFEKRIKPLGLKLGKSITHKYRGSTKFEFYRVEQEPQKKAKVDKKKGKKAGKKKAKKAGKKKGEAKK